MASFSKEMLYKFLDGLTMTEVRLAPKLCRMSALDAYPAFFNSSTLASKV